MLITLIYLLNYAIYEIVAMRGNHCSWNNCPKWDHNILNIHIVPYSNDDMGWVKTANQYYFYGPSRKKRQVSIRDKFPSVIQSLKKNPERRFSYSEIGFLKRWLDEFSIDEVNAFKTMVNTGQIELVSGGWVQPDEAGSHYVDLIDMYSLSLRILNETFGECGRPKVTWQLNSFGHSREFGNLLRMMGYETFLITRAHYTELEERKRNKTLRFNWHVSNDKETTLLTEILPEKLGAPNGFCWDIFKSIVCFSRFNDPIIDNSKFGVVNVERKLNAFIKEVEAYRNATTYNHIMVRMGSDFGYSMAEMWYENIDKLIFYIHQRYPNKYRIFYSTPSCYAKAIKEEVEESLKDLIIGEKYDDFFPYATTKWAYWTGYFTSRPSVKRLIRKSSSLLQMTKQYSAMALNVWSNLTNRQIEELENALATSQGHDALSGTVHHAVAEDYIYQLLKGWSSCEAVINRVMQSITLDLKQNSRILPMNTICRYLNETACEITSIVKTKNAPNVVLYHIASTPQKWTGPLKVKNIYCVLRVENHIFRRNSNYLVTVHNSNSHHMNTLIRIPLYHKNIKDIQIIDANNNRQIYQIVPTFKNPFNKGTYQLNNTKMAENELCFKVNSPPLGFHTYSISIHPYKERYEPSKSMKTSKKHFLQFLKEYVNENYLTNIRSISNGLIQLDFNNRGYLVTYHDLLNKKEYQIKQEFLYYHGYKNDHHGKIWWFKGGSGHYVFRPKGEMPYRFEGQISFQIINGPLVKEVRQVVSKYVSQVIRLIPNKAYVEFEWTIGPINRADKISKEIITQYTVKGLNSNGIFWTDSNGRQLIKRKILKRYNDVENVASNYYPITSFASISDDKTSMSIITDRSHGCTSLENGQLEIMLHRRLLYQDFGILDEVLNERGSDGRGLVVRGKHWLVIGNSSRVKTVQRKLAFEMFHEPILTFSTFDSHKQYHSNFITQYSGLKQPLPDNVKLTTLKPLDSENFLVRVEHIYEHNDGSNLSQPIAIDLADIVPNYTIHLIRELKLAGNEFLKIIENSRIMLKRMEIRTFQITVMTSNKMRETPLLMRINFFTFTVNFITILLFVCFCICCVKFYYKAITNCIFKYARLLYKSQIKDL